MNHLDSNEFKINTKFIINDVIKNMFEIQIKCAKAFES